MSDRKLGERGRARRVWQLYLAAGVGGLALYYFYAPLKGNGIIINLIGLSSALAMIVGVRLFRPKSSAAWYLFAIGHLLFVTGDVFYYSYPLFSTTEIPFPSIGDFFYLAVYPLLVAGSLILIRRRNPGGDRASLIDALIISTGLALLSWVLLMAPYAHDAGLSTFEKVVLMGYPAMDVLLLAVAVRLSVDNGRRLPALYLLVLSIVSLLATDAIFGLISLNGVYVEGGLLDAGWAAYYLFWGAAALHPSMRNLDEPSPNRETRLTRTRLVLLTCASMITPALRLISSIRDQATDEMVLLVGSVLLHGLVIARLAGLLHQHERSVARERALREAGQALVATAGREDVHRAALRSMLSLAGPAYEVRLLLYSGGDDVRVLALSDRDDTTADEWAIPVEELVAIDDAKLQANEPLDLDLAELSDLREELSVSPDTHRAVAFPVTVKDDLKGIMLVAGNGLSRQVKDSLHTLAVKVSLALESATLTEDLHRRKSESRFRSLVQNSTDVITVIEADTTIKFQSPSVEKVLGYQIDELIGTKLVELLHPHERESVLNVLAERLQENQPEAVDCRLRHRDGSWLYFEILRTNLLHDPNVGGIVLNGRDVSERKAFEEQLTHQAFHDPLTNLANRALFADRVQHALARQARESSSLAVIFIDLDDFKIINDSLGHGPGDQVLAEVGTRMNGCMRPMDTLARFGGDEFAVLLEDLGEPEEVAEVSERILKALEAPFTLDDKEVYVNASMGITVVRGEEAMTLGADELMRNADVAMYMAKREGKGHYRVFEPEMHLGVLERLELKGDLQRAIEHGELELYYQPIVELDSKQISGLEALVRWNHPTRGLVPPLDFIPLAEETGLIVPLGRWVLLQACRQAKELQDAYPSDPPLGMSVNLSVRQLQQHGLPEHVSEALRESGLDARCLTLEITESMLMNDAELTIVKLKELKQLGIRLAVDDFGTGYSSLSYLSQFPVDVLKIDRAFVRPVTEGAEESALAAAIVKLGEALHLTTVAEGIENPAQMARLVELGCDVGQGFYFAKPMEIADVIEYLDPRRTPGGVTSESPSPGRDTARSEDVARAGSGNPAR
ncbi:MAG: putative bifunctional diguanylate cyclase/phosphodiesterase [Actinomycetota bacterium]